MYELRIKTSFAAAHNLREYQGMCERLHGHNWNVEIGIESKELNELGMVLDFRDAKKAINEVIEKFDHYYLNELEYFKTQNPTTENIARVIAEMLSDKLETGLDISYVRVWESKDSSAIYKKG